VNFTTSLPTLLRVTRGTPDELGMKRRLLGCKRGEHLHAPSSAVKAIPDLQWSHCPVDLLDSPHMRAVDMLSKLAAVSPLAGWPDRYAAWAVHGVMVLREARP